LSEFSDVCVNDNGDGNMPVLVRDLLYEFAKDMQRLFGEKLSRIVVYGSYARGDYTKDSDIDVMVLVKIPEDKIHNFTDQVSDCAFEYLLKYGIDISPVIKNEEHFNYWADNLPYYRNVRDEGVIIHAG
jgi:predicted nucleotidyltransferase